MSNSVQTKNGHSRRVQTIDLAVARANTSVDLANRPLFRFVIFPFSKVYHVFIVQSREKTIRIEMHHNLSETFLFSRPSLRTCSFLCAGLCVVVSTFFSLGFT